LFGGATAWIKAKTFIKNRKFGYASLLIVAALLCTVVFSVENSEQIYSQVIAVINPPKMMIGRNEPVGVAKGIFPGRVVWVHNPGVANWDGKTGFWFEDR